MVLRKKVYVMGNQQSAIGTQQVVVCPVFTAVELVATIAASFRDASKSSLRQTLSLPICTQFQLDLEGAAKISGGLNAKC